MAAAPSMYERVGGDAFFDALTRRFYDAVTDDPVLRPLYPEDPDEFEAARVHLRDFLVQRHGGPPVYRASRGEPRLGARHARFAIGQEERDAWVRLMTEAVRAARIGGLDESQLLAFFDAMATHLVNRPGAA